MFDNLQKYAMLRRPGLGIGTGLEQKAEAFFLNNGRGSALLALKRDARGYGLCVSDVAVCVLRCSRH